MKITKLGHCCLLIEEKGLRILTDPGMFTQHYFLQVKNSAGFTVGEHEKLEKIDVLLITHEHADHLHADSVKVLVKNNPGIRIVTNQNVGKILAGLGLAFKEVSDGQKIEIGGVSFEGFGKDHEPIYGDYGLVENTGYFIGGRLFYPGDAFTDPGKSVEILALPVAGPWMQSKAAIDYGKKIHPKICFPVHDGFLKTGFVFHSLPKHFLEQEGIVFIEVDQGEVGEF